MMCEAERREARMLFEMSSLLKVAAEEINRLAIKCEGYADSYDALLNDYECLKEKMEKEVEEDG